MDKKSTSKSLYKRSVTWTKSNSCESLHVNTERSNKTGEHWMAVIFTKMTMCFTLIPMDYHHLKQKSLTFQVCTYFNPPHRLLSAR